MTKTSLFARAVLLALFTLPLSAAETPALDPALPYQAEKSNPVTYDVDFSVVITPPYKAKLLRVWLPIPQSDVGQEYTEGELTTFPMQVKPVIGTENVYGNTFAYFEFKDANGAQIIHHTFKIKVYELHWNLDPAKIAATATWPDSFAPYLKGQSQAVVADDRFTALLNQIVPQKSNPEGHVVGDGLCHQGFQIRSRRRFAAAPPKSEPGETVAGG